MSRGLSFFFVAAAALIGIGCAIPAYVMQVMPRTIPAVYEPTDTPTLILVDDPDNRLGSRPEASLLAQQISVPLREEQVITTFVDPGLVDALRLNHADFDTWSLSRIGREVGAAQMIHVRVTAVSFGGTGTMARPIATAEVKVFDVGTQRRLFPAPDIPTDARGYPITSRMFLQDTTTAGGVDPLVIRRRLMLELAGDIARLFYEYPDDPESTVGETM